MITALCAYIKIVQMSDAGFGNTLLEEAVRIQKGCAYYENSSLLAIITFYLFYSCHLHLGRDNSAWDYLRQATALAHLLNMHTEDAYTAAQWDMEVRCLYWALFTAERCDS
jgi:beta-xylosidase